MARPIWTGNLSFGLLNVPVSLMAGSRSTDLSFRMLDARDKQPIRFERVNAETGEEVPWKDIVKAFEYDKGSYVVIDKEDIAAAAPQSHESVDIETFVDEGAIDPRFFEKPYVLVPGKKAEKGYVLLRETLKKAKKTGIARVVIRSREYLAALMPHEDAINLVLMRYPQEVVDPAEYNLPKGAKGDYRITAKELEMAVQLIDSMSGPFQPEMFHDEFRERLTALIKKRVKAKGSTAKIDETPAVAEDATTNVVDFMALLAQSLSKNGKSGAAAKKTSSVRKRSVGQRKVTTSRKTV